MHSIKQSNWILGLGVVVAIVLIATTIWIKTNAQDTNDAVLNKTTPEISQSIKLVDISKLRWVTSFIKTLN